MHAINFIQDLAVIMLVAGVVTILFTVSGSQWCSVISWRASLSVRIHHRSA